MKSLKRILEITGGALLILIGIVMIFTPGQGLLAIIGGVFLISPQHGRRLVWYIKKAWKRVKMFWYSWRFKRVVKRKILIKAKRLKQKISLKK
ncbi:MAG: hypothetical protein K9L85_00295 [Candidatus Peribacteraceae bacterium]|nr:hypothetical protein [Candidatus Peribacteraceae bacterium]